MESPNFLNGQQSIYGIDPDYKVIDKAFKAIKEFYKEYRTNPDYVIVGSLVFVSIAHYYMENYFMSFNSIDSFENVRMILDPSAAKDSAIAVFASPSKVLMYQVKPDEVKPLPFY